MKKTLSAFRLFLVLGVLVTALVGFVGPSGAADAPIDDGGGNCPEVCGTTNNLCCSEGGETFFGGIKQN